MAEPIRVVHVVVAGDVGGAERLLVDLASRPERSSATHTVALMTPNPALRGLFAGAGLHMRDRGPVRENPVAYLWRSFGPTDTSWLTSVLREERADLAHLHTFGSHVLGARAARRANIPFLRTEHHVQYFIDPSTSPFTRWSLRRATAVVAISDYVRAYVEKTAPYAAAKMRVVRNGADAEYFAPRPRDAGGGRPFTFAVACRLEPWKEVHRVIEALALVPAATLIIAGDGSERARLEKLSAQLSLGARVRFLGYLKDPRDAMAQADVCVSASRDEPLGLSVLEAQAMGRPVIAFLGGGIPEIVKDGVSGWLVRERSTSALARAMSDAASSPARAEEMGRAARAWVLAEHRVERMCEGYGRVYAELARR